MFCTGDFIFKEVKKTDAGSFTKENGEIVEYDSSYRLKVDELTDEGIKERNFKFSLDNPQLYNDLLCLHAYDKIKLNFDLFLNNYDKVNSNARLVPTSVELVD